MDGIDQGAITTHTFTNVTDNHAISATFTHNDTEYLFIKGANGEWKNNADNTLEFTVNGELDNLIRIEVDGKIIDDTNYELKSENTIIIFTVDYLKTLSAGTHNITAVYSDGKAATSFKVTQTSNTPEDETSENDNPVSDVPTGDIPRRSLDIAILALITAGAMLWKRKKHITI